MSIMQKMNPKDLNNKSEEDKAPLEKLGYNEWFNTKGEEYLKQDYSIARIVEVNRNNYKVSNGNDEIVAELSGKYLFTIENSTDYPTVGDWVVVQYFDDHSLAIIHHLLPRKSLMRRKDPGKAVEHQLIAANIDYAFIMQAVDSNFNMNRLERYFVMINESKIQPIVILSKTDLISEEALFEINEKIRRFDEKYMFLPISNVNNDGIEKLQKELQPNKTYCLIGSSGVGKTTLLNKLLGEQRLEVNAVREKDSKGKHTTVRRQLIRLESGSIFIDTPGMRELATFSVDNGIDETFDEIVKLSSQCRFQDCTHIHVEGCAVIHAVEEGAIDQDRYNNFLKIQKESKYYAMSYIEKRKKDKSFGKIVKEYKKSVRKK